jgi:hypothetical protein
MLIKKISFIILLCVPINLSAQKIGIEYRTSIDSSESLHYLSFKRDGTVSIRFWRGPGVYFHDQIQTSITYYYKKIGDTIKINTNSNDINLKDNPVIQRILNSKFILTPKGYLYDFNSGFTYVDNKLTKKTSYGAIAFDGKLYIIRKRGTNSLRRKIKDLNSDNYVNNIIRGKKAFDKYGIKGINGVIELNKKLTIDQTIK